MKLKFQSFVASATMAMLVAGCENHGSGSATTTPQISPSAITTPITDRWLGKWSGPEGTFLQLNGGNGNYEITIQNLDGPSTFRGSAAGNEIEFERNGVKESLHAANGDETGMKWLSEKSDCLRVRAGEGYCRD